LEKGWRPCEDFAFLLRRAAGGEEELQRGDDHEVSILIRPGGGGRAGRTPSKVSMMIIRPPQQLGAALGDGHRRYSPHCKAELKRAAADHHERAPLMKPDARHPDIAPSITVSVGSDVFILSRAGLVPINLTPLNEAEWLSRLGRVA